MADYLFTDLHLHSMFSNEDLCDESPELILNKVQGYVNKFNSTHGANAKCVVSIADHNSIHGCIQAQKLITNGIYPNVDFVNGVEFTVDLKEFGDDFAGGNIFTRCHMLGYNYDHKNKELAAYSKIGYTEIRREPFEKTPKQSIRRFMYK